MAETNLVSTDAANAQINAVKISPNVILTDEVREAIREIVREEMRAAFSNVGKQQRSIGLARRS